MTNFTVYVTVKRLNRWRYSVSLHDDTSPSDSDIDWMILGPFARHRAQRRARWAYREFMKYAHLVPFRIETTENQ